MVKCKHCGVPLSGFLNIIPAMLFQVKPSSSDPILCNRCAAREKEKRYKCHLCGRMIHENRSLEHIKAEEYFVNLIRKDHSHWGEREPSGKECVDYYRQLIQKAEI